MAETAKESISMPASLSEAAKLAAEREGRSFSSLVAYALREWLERQGYVLPAAQRDPVLEVVREAEAAGVDVVAVLQRAARKRKEAAA